MKFAPFLAASLTIFALNAQAVETCFKSNPEGTVIGKLQMSEKALTVKWDVDDFTEASRETGTIRNFKNTATEMTGEALIGNIADVGTVWITVSDDTVKFQEADAHGTLKPNVDVRERIACPTDISPDEQ